MFNPMANNILGYVQMLPILSGARSSTSDCSGDNPSLLAQKKVASNQLQIKLSKWVTQNPSLGLE